MTAVVEARRAPARVAAFVKLMPLLEPPPPGIRHWLATPARRRRPNTEPLELVPVERLRPFGLDVEQLERRHAVVRVRHRAGGRLAAEHEGGQVLLRLDGAAGGEAEADELGGEPLPELGLGQKEKVVVRAAQHRQGGDHAGLRGQQQRLARLAGREGLDVVRDHPLQVARSVPAADGNERAGPGGRL
jgi:hypothetical protein